MTEINSKSKSSQNNFSYLAWVLLLVVSLVAAYFIYSNRQKSGELESLASEKEAQRTELQANLDSLMAEHEQIKLAYGDLADSLTSKDSIIVANAKEINDLLNYKWEYRKVQKKLDQLRLVAQTYVNQMDSLYVVNQHLVEENQNIKQRYNSEQRKNSVLEKEKEQLTGKIVEASVLEAYNVTATGIYTKKSSSETETTKARRVNKVKVCFTLSKNVVLRPGTKDVYVRIARPDNKILSPGIAEDFVFEYKGEMIQYSIYKQINYDNQAIYMCLFWTKKFEEMEMQTGKYQVIVFADGQEIGETSFVLD